MKITSVTGVDKIENVKCFKPICKVFVKAVYPDGVVEPQEDKDPQIRVRLVDGQRGSSAEVVPEMPISILSEIASKYEGFQRRPASVKGAGGVNYLSGYSTSSVILGQQLDMDTISAVDLSNDKYVDIDLRGLDPRVTYEIWGMESHVINPFIRTYRKFYLSQGEIEKNFSVGDNEVLVYPIDQIKEIQLYAKNSQASPVFRKEELILDEDSRNDLVWVGLTGENLSPISEHSTVQAKFGFSKWGVMSVDEFNSFDIRREDGLEALTFLMIDTVPTLVTVVQEA